MKEILICGLVEMGLTPPTGAVQALERYAELLIEQNKVMNLTAITEPEAVARLHFLDSAGVLSRGGEGAGCWKEKRVIDVGTGAGFPGLVLKLLEPTLSLTLLDSLGKRVTWLESVCGTLGLEGVQCLHARAEEQALEPGFRDSFDVAVSRAVASLPQLCELCLPYVRVGGVFLAMKSVESGEETLAARRAVKRLGGELLEAVDYAIPGTDVIHRLVPVRKTGSTPKGYPRKWAKIKKEPL